MSHIHFQILIIISLLFPLSGCNDDVFVDGLPVEAVTATIEGDGGAAEFTVATKDLLNISIDYYGGSNSLYKYYDVNGKEVESDCPASDLSAIIYENILTHFEVVKEGNRLKIISYENALGNDVYVSIRLTYTYTTEFIEINITQGRPLELVSVVYDDYIEVKDNAFTLVDKSVFYNKGSFEQQIEVWPMLQAQRYANGIITAECSWARGFTVDMPVLKYSDDGWKLLPVGSVPTHGTYGLVIPDLLDRVSVTVEARANVSIRSVVTVTEALAYGVMHFRMPVSGRQYSTRFACDAKFPKSYEVIVDEIDK